MTNVIRPARRWLNERSSSYAGGMVRREERRLRAVFQRILVAGLSFPAVGCAGCGGGAHSTAEASVDATTEDAGDDVPALFGDAAAPDVFVAWCDAGPPQLVDGDACYLFLTIPCGLPSNIVVGPNGALSSLDCLRVCPVEAGPPEDCQVLAADGWTGSGVDIECTVCSSGRRPPGLRRARVAPSGDPVAEWFVRAAYLESAAVMAFRCLREELRALGAPRSLLREARRSELDEMRHARAMRRLAVRRGGHPEMPYVNATRSRSLLALALDNAVEGCVRETYGALVARWQSQRAADRHVVTAMTVIAEDETRHAALAWAIARWAEQELGPTERARVVRARRRAVARLRDESAVSPPDEAVWTLGLPTAAQASQLIDELTDTVWS